MKELSHLAALEAEAIYIFREAVALAAQPVMLYSIGKDSSVLLHLARKAFYPAALPFPLLHVNTGWKFHDMIRFRDAIIARYGLKLIEYINQDGVAAGINPIDSGSEHHTEIMKTVALRQALDRYQLDLAFGGARRDEEKSRAKERIFSHRTAAHRWEPRGQRPEPWLLFNTRKQPGESFRVFPMSNWTEEDVWHYIAQENIPVVPLYFAARRQVVRRGGTWIMRDDDRLTLRPGEKWEEKMVRFRTLGCYPLTGAIESEATSLAAIRSEMQQSRQSERAGRLIDQDGGASMEAKKQEGYF
ncbi:MAG: sulfate adenylyltransferase subunit CysD [Candidatus Symbiobacter sp.]|nr:sulfate adenylyltransferase subunit CysD [Candidatus Symbiobacter sp.]